MSESVGYANIERRHIGQSYPCTTDDGRTVMIVRSKQTGSGVPILYDDEGNAFTPNYTQLTITRIQDTEGTTP
jgi:hypothetical protein